MTNIPGLIDGVPSEVDTQLIATPPYQRSLSTTWVAKEQGVGFNPALGYGIVLNKVSLAQHKARKNGKVDDRAVTYAESIGSKFLYEVIIGQHRSNLALALSIPKMRALVLDNVSDDEAALLYVHDARTTRPLRGYDVHQAALIRNEPRAVAIQAALDKRGLTLVPSGLKDGQVSCIRALEKVCGVVVDDPDEVSLAWTLDVLTVAFPKAKWNDPMVHGLNLARKGWIKDGKDLPKAKEVGTSIYKSYRGDPAAFVDEIRRLAKSITSPSPHRAALLWTDGFKTIGVRSFADVDD